MGLAGLASELLQDHFPPQVVAELVHPEELTVVKGREVVDVDLTSLKQETSSEP